MVALFFLSISVGTTLAGILAGFYNRDTEVTYFAVIGGTAIGLGLILAALVPMLKRTMRGVR